MKFGFVGQGYIGKNMADDYEERGYEVVRYALEEPYKQNAKLIADCDAVFIAVPTPTADYGVDSSIVEASVELAGDDSVVIIKSTIAPGTTARIQEKYPKKTILFSPEFLSKATAPEDARNPLFNIIGLPVVSDTHKKAAAVILKTLPQTKNTFTVRANSAEQFKYIHNVHGFIRIVMANLFNDWAGKIEADWEEIMPMMDVNPMMSPYYNQPIHKTGRGAGGGCFIKDYLAFRKQYEEHMEDDDLGLGILRALEEKNLELLRDSEKDQHIVLEVYGEDKTI